MKIVFHSLTVVVAAGLGLLTGNAIRSKSEHSIIASMPEHLVGAKTHLKSNSISRRGDSNAGFDSPLATRLAHDLSLSAGVTRWLYWLEAIEKAQPSDFPSLLRLAKENPAALK